MKDRDIDTIIGPPTRGLSTYRNSVQRALREPAAADDDATDSSAAALLTTDPAWAHHGRP